MAGRKPPMPPIPSKKSKNPTSPAKVFSVGKLTGEGEGEKIVLYGGSGVGKTTLCTLAPSPIFLPLDDGGRKIRNPITGESLDAVTGIDNFQDVRDALNQQNLWSPGSTAVIDTFTVLENLAEPWMFENIPHEKGGKVSSIEGYGYGKGWTHLFDTMRLVLQDCDGLIRRGVNVVLICQNMAIKRANPGGVDFLEDGPKLSHSFTEKTSVRLHVCEWADHVVRVAWANARVLAPDGDKTGKIQGDTERAVFTMPELHYFAKTRTLGEPVISFSHPADNSFWRFLCPNANLPESESGGA